MKGAVSTIVLVIIAVVVITLAVYNYNKSAEKPLIPTGKAVTGGSENVDRLGFLESCNPNRDRCDVGLICALGRDNIYYRCLRTG